MRTLAIVFTRHQLTQAQLNEIGERSTIDFTDLASREITTTDEAFKVVKELFDRLQDTNVRYLNIYGVIPAPIRWALLRFHNFTKNITNIRIYESFNTKRSKEGEKPTFEHKEWLHTQTI